MEKDGHYAGIMDLQKLNGGTLLAEADYYVCGPAPFIRKQVRDRTAMRVSPAAIHFEEFGPATLTLYRCGRYLPNTILLTFKPLRYELFL